MAVMVDMEVSLSLVKSIFLKVVKNILFVQNLYKFVLAEVFLKILNPNQKFVELKFYFVSIKVTPMVDMVATGKFSHLEPLN